MASPTEKDLILIEHALKAAEKPPLYEHVLALPLILQELEGWLADEHQWRSGKPKNWATLLADLEASRRRVGPNLKAALEADAGQFFKEAQLVRSTLRNGDSPPDESSRRRLTLAAQAIRSCLLRDSTLAAAWSDLVETPGSGAKVDSARLMLSVGELRGNPPASLASRLRGILADGYYAVMAARGETPRSEDPPSAAGASTVERISLAEGILTELPFEADVVVWLLYALTPKMWPPLLEVGEKVALYNAEWLGKAMEGQAAGYKVPEELKAEGICKRLIVRDQEFADDAHGDPVHRVAARIDLGRVRVSDAEEVARSSAEALIALASLQGGHSSPWVVEDSYSMFIDGRDGPWSMAAPATFRPTTAQRLAISEDWTAQVIEKGAERWGPHFPIQDERMQEAAHLLVWLRRARETWGPARLILCDRVIERVAGWAGLANPRTLIVDHLRISWAITRMRNEFAGIAWAAYTTDDVLSQIRDEDERKAFDRAREEIRWDPDLGLSLSERSWSVNPRGTLKRLDWLLERVPEDTPIGGRLARLADHTRTGQAAAAWAESLMTEFSALEARARRVRNALVHGGPASDPISERVLPFVEALAESALYISVEGRFDGVDLVDFFLQRRAANGAILDSLREGVPAVDALWPNQEPIGNST